MRAQAQTTRCSFPAASQVIAAAIGMPIWAYGFKGRLSHLTRRQVQFFLHGCEKPANLIAGRSDIAAGADRALEQFARRNLPERRGRLAMQAAEFAGNFANQADLPVYWKGSHVC